jgi:hypothetical protein
MLQIDFNADKQHVNIIQVLRKSYLDLFVVKRDFIDDISCTEVFI